MATLLNVSEDSVIEVSGRTGQGTDSLLAEIIHRIPSPKEEFPGDNCRALVFDFQYDNHRGVIVYVRVMDGSITKGSSLLFRAANEKFIALEVGIFSPEEEPRESISAGEIGYIVTGIKKPGIASVGDTIALEKRPLPALSGYFTPKPVVWASIYPESQDDFDQLRQALGRLRLSDSSFSHEEESSGSLGRGFRCGFLGMLHLEIITERLRREFQLELVVTLPSITYEVTLKNGKTEMIYSPSFFPDDGNVIKVREPWVNLRIITPSQYLGPLMQTLFEHEAEVGDTETFGEGRSSIGVKMPLRELMRNFFDEVKSVSSGYASLSYEIEGYRDADVTRLDIMVADEPVIAFTRVVSHRRVEEEAEKSVEKLSSILPRQMFTLKIQGKAMGRIISSRTLSGMKKDVTQHMYGGDITRKMKLREKQKKGKKKMKAHGSVEISHDVFLKMMK